MFDCWCVCLCVSLFVCLFVSLLACLSCLCLFVLGMCLHVCGMYDLPNVSSVHVYVFACGMCVVCTVCMYARLPVALFV